MSLQLEAHVLQHLCASTGERASERVVRDVD